MLITDTIILEIFLMSSGCLAANLPCAAELILNLLSPAAPIYTCSPVHFLTHPIRNPPVCDLQGRVQKVTHDILYSHMFSLFFHC